MADRYRVKSEKTGYGAVMWLGPLMLAGLAIFLYMPVFKYMLYRIKSADDFDYVYLAPLVLGYLLWEQRHELIDLPKQPTMTGVILFVLGLMLFWLGELGGEYYTQYLSFLIITAGAVWALLGTTTLKKLAFVFVTAIFFLPFPNFIVQVATARLQLISSSIGVLFLRLLGKSVYKEGNVIDLGFSKLQVVEACSGLRYVLPLLILALLMGHILKVRMWKRAVLFVAAIPVAVLANALRIAATALLMEHFGKKAVEGFFHDFEGFFIFFFALACMSGIAKLLNLVSKEPQEPDTMEKMAPSNPKKKGQWTPRKAYAVFAAMFVLLGASCYAYSFVNFREAVPVAKPLGEFPTEIGVWKGEKGILPERFLSALDLTDYILIDYVDSRGRPVNFYVAYYESQRKGESIHSPATCLRGSGWVFEKAGSKIILVPGVGRIKVRAATLVKNREKQLVYYWFQKGDKVIDNVWALKWWVFWDALTKRRTDGALVRIIAPIMPNETEIAARSRLDEFVMEVVPVLNQYLPGA